jgi:predicted nucleic acid-binding protein
MQKKFYLDTCIWRDLLEDRKSGYSFLGESAFQFLKSCREHEFRILCSDLVINELNNYFSNEEIDSLLEPFLDLIEFVNYIKEEAIEARLVVNNILGVHSADVLHAIIARDNNAVIITRDRHFDKLSEIVISLKPEEVRFD